MHEVEEKALFAKIPPHVALLNLFSPYKKNAYCFIIHIPKRKNRLHTPPKHAFPALPFLFSTVTGIRHSTYQQNENRKKLFTKK